MENVVTNDSSTVYGALSYLVRNTNFIASQFERGCIVESSPLTVLIESLLINFTLVMPWRIHSWMIVEAMPSTRV